MYIIPGLSWDVPYIPGTPDLRHSMGLFLRQPRDELLTTTSTCTSNEKHKCKPSAQLHSMLQQPAQMKQALLVGLGTLFFFFGLLCYSPMLKDFAYYAFRTYLLCS